MALFECLMRKKTKEPIVYSSPKLKDKEKRAELEKNGSSRVFLVLEREGVASL